MIMLRIFRDPRAAIVIVTVLAGSWLARTAAAAPPAPSFAADIKPLLSNRCVRCHGPDDATRQGGGEGGLRLDTPAGASADLGGHAAIVPGDPAASALIDRISSTDPATVMPPPEAGEPLSPEQIEAFRAWIAAGATFERHWSYVPPTRPAVPVVEHAGLVRSPIDAFVLSRLEREGLAFQPEADRAVLARRLSLDLVGLPPTPEAVDAFVADPAPDAYERYLDRLLADDGYGEHQARQWLDLARYADSAGYADDPPRSIWGFRDWVIRAFDANMPFDRFTTLQLAGDLLPGAGPDDRMATAFHRNTMTNTEGGTIDEEFRTAAVVDRVNTTFGTWMGTTIACAQCHNHKYDPISQEDFFRIFAVFNNTADADRGDDTPVLEFFTQKQESERTRIGKAIADTEHLLATDTPELVASRAAWDAAFPRAVGWTTLRPLAATASPAPPAEAPGVGTTIDADGTIHFPAVGARGTQRIDLPVEGTVAAIELTFPGDAALPGGSSGHAGNLVLTGISARLEPADAAAAPRGRFVRVELPGADRILSLAEVEVFRNADNIARGKPATQVSTTHDAPAGRAVDGVTEGAFFAANSVTHTDTQADPWWEVDLGSDETVDRIVVWNRTDGGVGVRLAGARVTLLDAARQPVWQTILATAPESSVALEPVGGRDVPLAVAFASRSQDGFPAIKVLERADETKELDGGWAPGGAAPATLVVAPAEAVAVKPGERLVVSLRERSKHDNHTIGVVRVAVSAEPRVKEWAGVPADVIAILVKPAPERTGGEIARLAEHHRRVVAAETAPARERMAALTAELAAIKPAKVPVMEELGADKRRVTKVQHRGNWQDLGAEVQEGVPEAFQLPATPSASGRIDRLALAQWLVDPANPLTARVTVNRLWERLFGTGLVSTSEEFGSQGDLPSDPQLLDWLAVELVDRGWDTKAILREIVSSATYRQTSKADPAVAARDPDNRLLARGPRVRLSAEVIRDQALAAAGLLSRKKGGPSVNPPQPNMGLSAAFGGGIDWQTSQGEDRWRRAIYTTWRRSNPYPSMAAFDAPNREVCTIRRPRTNTPLQALVTLNDPVYIEAAQALSRRMVAEGGSTDPERVIRGFRLVLARPPTAGETGRLVQLHADVLAEYRQSPEEARKLATEPLGPPAEASADLADLAAWTVVANVILNLDESFMCP
jgi:mono/diheme cytochrome c family protein